MAISGVTNNTSTSGLTNTTPTVTKDEFLRLFVTQLKNQNPLSPMDSTGFTSQLAQFSSLEQLTNLNASMSNLIQYQNSIQNVMAIDMIGKSVEVSGNQVNLSGSAAINFALPGAAAKTTLSIYNSSGACVRKIELGQQSAGSVKYTWDGKNDAGATLPDGQYTFGVSAADAKGVAVPATTLMFGTVTGITFEDSTTYLVLNTGQKIKFGDIRRIGS